MKNLLIGTLASMTMFVMIGAAQDVPPPIFDQSTTAPSLTVSAGDSHCVFFRLPDHDAIFINCFRGHTEVLSTRLYPPNGQSVGGGLGMTQLPVSTYTWVFTQNPKNVFTFVITANGVSRSGTL